MHNIATNSDLSKIPYVHF